MDDYQHTVVVQFKVHDNDINILQELEFCDKLQDDLDTLMVAMKMGEFHYGCYGGSGTAEIFLRTNDVGGCVDVLKKELSHRELLSFCKIASSNDYTIWVTHYSLTGDIELPYG